MKSEERWMAGEAWSPIGLLWQQPACGWRPPVDIYETEKGLLVRLEIAGMREEDFHITLTASQLTVAGRREDWELRRGFRQMEIPFGAFQVQVALPWAPVQALEATYEQGFLRICIPYPLPPNAPLPKERTS